VLCFASDTYFIIKSDLKITSCIGIFLSFNSNIIEVVFKITNEMRPHELSIWRYPNQIVVLEIGVVQCQVPPTVDLYKQDASLSPLGEHSTCNMATLVSAGSSLTSAV
jgi:hypothetical protein